MATVGYVGATGDKEIDGLLSGYRWNGILTYSFPDSKTDYSSGYGNSEPLYGFAQVSAAQQAVIHRAMALVTQYTNLTVNYSGTDGADIRVAQSSRANPTAYAYYPGGNEGGDIWFGTSYNYRSPQLGNYSYLTHIHEMGHALGLKHSHELGGPGSTAVPTAHDSLEYTVMSYRAYTGESLVGGYGNETYGFPTTFMMNDIRALQQMYGADFTTQSSDTVYSWSATTGEWFIDGVGQGRPGGVNAPASANVVLMTVWDGNGNDTYDFSNYTTGVTVDLRPGAYSITSAAQTAYLGDGHSAKGSVYNAYLYNGDTRSYIENAIGGSGSDKLVGNAVANRLDGGAGNDTLTGGSGTDVFVFRSGYGADIITDFSVGFDQVDLSGLGGYADYASVMGVGSQIGADTLFSFSFSLSLKLLNVAFNTLSAGDFLFAWSEPDADTPNAAPTGITLGNATVDENRAGLVVGGLTVADADDTAFDFYVSDARFEVAGAPGAYVLKLVNGASLDFENQPSIDLTVTATDDGGLSVAQDFSILVNDLAGATITGTAGRDYIDGKRTVKDQPKATTEDDIVNAGAGADTVYALAGDDVIDGGAGDDYLSGDEGNDRLIGGLGADRLYGGAGDDVFVIQGSDALSDTIAGGAGIDTVEVTGAGAVTLSRFVGSQLAVEAWAGNGQGVLGTARNDVLDFSGLHSVSDLSYVDGGAGNDLITGTGNADDLRGGLGNDTIFGGGGDDRITGGAGVDTLDGGAGDDIFVFGGAEAASDIMRGGTGTDTVEITGLTDVTLSRFDTSLFSIEAWHGNGAGVIGTRAADTLNFSAIANVSGLAFIDGGDGNDKITGTSGTDVLRGGTGNDLIHGGDGGDRITGGAGVDTLDGGAGDDIFMFGGAEAASDIMRGGTGGDAIDITGLANVTLSRFDAGASSIEAWHGNGAGVLGTRGADILDFSALTEISGLAFIDSGDGNDKITGTSGADALRGGTGNDLIHGGDGDDRITGGAGVDTLDGGAGDDIFMFGGADAASDIMRGGIGHDAIDITGLASVTLSRFDAGISSIETWHGNGAGVLGTRGADILDFSALTEVSGLAFIDGGDGNDQIIGTADADVLRGGTGNDALTGGYGDDVLSGGRGNDRFSFGPGLGHDRITDFEAGSRIGDVIVMDSAVFANLESLLAASSQLGANVVITASATDSLTLQNVMLSSLHANDFAFV